MRKMIYSKRYLVMIVIVLLLSVIAMIVIGVEQRNSVDSGRRNEFIFSGTIIQENGEKDTGVFRHDWETNTNEKLFSSDEVFMDMSFSEDRRRIIALDDSCNVKELDLDGGTITTLMQRQEIIQLLADAGHPELIESANDFSVGIGVSHVFYCPEGFFIDYKGTLYRASVVDNWQLAEVKGLPRFNEFFVVNNNGEKLLLKTSDYDHLARDFDSHNMSFILCDLDGNNAETILETENLDGYPFGDRYSVGLNADRSRFAYVNYSDSDHVDICYYNLISFEIEKTDKRIKKLGTGTLNFRRIYYLLDSDELLGNLTKAGFSGDTVVISKKRVRSVKSFRIITVNCCVL